MRKAVRGMGVGLLLLGAAGARAATVTLDWLAVTQNADGSAPIADLTGYRVYSSTDAALTGMTTAQAFASPAVTKTVPTPPTALTLALTGLLDGASCHFRLTAYDASFNESDFNVDQASGLTVDVSTFTPLPAPAGLTATALSSSTIRLNWTSASNNETGFVVERSLNGTTGFAPAAGSPAAVNATSFTETGLSPGTSYFYRVRTVNAAASSLPTPVANATTQAGPPPPDTTPPAAPRGLRVR